MIDCNLCVHILILFLNHLYVCQKSVNPKKLISWNLVVDAGKKIKGVSSAREGIRQTDKWSDGQSRNIQVLVTHTPWSCNRMWPTNRQWQRHRREKVGNNEKTNGQIYFNNSARSRAMPCKVEVTKADEQFLERNNNPWPEVRIQSLIHISPDSWGTN